MEFNINKVGEYIKITDGLDVSCYPKTQVIIYSCDDIIIFKLINNEIILNINYKYLIPRGETAADTVLQIINLLNKD